VVELPQKPGSLRSFLDQCLGPNYDIVLFEYTKKNNRTLGPALVAIELQRPADLQPFVERMDSSGLRVQRVSPGSPLYRLFA
jgi:threonine dehydratase